MIRFIIILCLLLLFAGVILQNRDNRVEITTIPGQRFSLSLPLLLVISALLGTVFPGILLVPGWFRTRREIKKQRHTIERMQDELAHLRNQIHTYAPLSHETVQETAKDEIEHL